MLKKVKKIENAGVLPKLSYICIGILNSSSLESIDYLIANYLSHNIHDLAGLSMQKIADACGVSKSTISRFCRTAGMKDYDEFKEQAIHVEPYRDFNLAAPLIDTDGTSYLDLVILQLQQLNQSIDYQSIKRLAKEIYDHDNVLLMGSMQAMNPAVLLQQDLFGAGKVARVPSVLALQQEALLRSRPDDLLIVFSNSGTFCEGLLTSENYAAKLKQMQVWMISGNENIKELSYVDHDILVPNNFNIVSHPTQFNLIARMIAIAFAEYSSQQEEQ